MRNALLTATVTGLLLIALPAATANISLPEGLDLLVVLPGSTADFSGPFAIPADYFGPGSDPFTGIVEVQGVPVQLEPLCQGDPAPAEIIIRRDPIVLPDPPSSQTIEIEIIQMTLVGASPITVTYNGGQNPEQWDIEIVPLLPPPPQPQPPVKRIIIINRNGLLDGDFGTTYEYEPILRVTRIDMPAPAPPPYIPPQPDAFGGQGPWGIPAIPFPRAAGTHQATPSELSCPGCKTDDFYLGFDGTQAQPFSLTGQFLDLNVMIACSGTVSADGTSWGKVKHKHTQ